jgi:hypothetical protein
VKTDAGYPKGKHPTPSATSAKFCPKIIWQLCLNF